MDAFYKSKKGEEVKIAMKENKEIKRANEEYEYLTGDEAERRLAFLREKAIKDEVTMLDGSREEGKRQGLEIGIKEGIREGKKEKQIEIAKKLLRKKVQIEIISEATELTIEEINKISKEIE